MDFKVGRGLARYGSAQPAALAGDRVVITRDSILQWKLEGRCFYVQQGDAVTKLDFVETTYDPNQPQFALCVPEGILCIPISMNIMVEDSGGSTENHIIWATNTNYIGPGDAAGSTVLEPVNYRRDVVHGAACRAYSLYTGDCTAQTGLIEVKRWFLEFAQADINDGPVVGYNNYNWTIDDPSMPVLLGPASLQYNIVSTGDGVEGYGFHTWIELPASDFGL